MKREEPRVIQFHPSSAFDLPKLKNGSWLIDKPSLVDLAKFFLFGRQPNDFIISCLLGELEEAVIDAPIELIRAAIARQDSDKIKSDHVVKNMVTIAQTLPEICRGSIEKIEQWVAWEGIVRVPEDIFDPEPWATGLFIDSIADNNERHPPNLWVLNYKKWDN